MSLNAGYNLVTERVEETEQELPALEFFRYLARDESVPSRVTVAKLEDFLFRAADDDIDATVRQLRSVIRKTRSFRGPQAIQIVFDGELVDDDVFTVRIERGGDAEYLPVGNLFVEEPQLMSPTHAVARK